MAHHDEYFSEGETVDINRREKIKAKLEEKFNNMSRDEKIDFVVDLVIEDYKYKQIWGR